MSAINFVVSRNLPEPLPSTCLYDTDSISDTTSLPRPKLSSWFSRDHWNERIICFNASWFTVCMGSGVVAQILNNIPYPARWLIILGYCYWILTIVLFTLFTIFGILRGIRYPQLSKKILEDFYQSSYLGAIPITLDTITVGITIYYNDRPAAMWAAIGLFWIAVAMCLIVGGIVVFITTAYNEPPEMKSVNGVWLLSFIPFIVTSSASVAICSHVGPTQQMILLIVGFLMWSLGVSMCMVITTIYFWRLTRFHLPMREAIVSCFIPVGPCGMGAYAIQNLAIQLSHYIRTQKFVLHLDVPTTNDSVLAAVSECVNLIGVIVALHLIAFGTFWLIQASAAVIVAMPKRFNIGFYASVFPLGVYANAVCQLAKDLNNDGFRIWAAFCVALTVVLWLGCSVGTLYRGVWCGELFFAPGLEGWNEKKMLGDADGKQPSTFDLTVGEHGNTSGDEAHNGDAERYHIFGQFLVSRTSRPDGTYGLRKTNQHKRAAQNA